MKLLTLGIVQYEKMPEPIWYNIRGGMPFLLLRGPVMWHAELDASFGI